MSVNQSGKNNISSYYFIITSIKGRIALQGKLTGLAHHMTDVKTDCFFNFCFFKVYAVFPRVSAGIYSHSFKTTGQTA